MHNKSYLSLIVIPVFQMKKIRSPNYLVNTVSILKN